MVLPYVLISFALKEASQIKAAMSAAWQRTVSWMDHSDENSGGSRASRSFIQPDPDGIQPEASVSGRPSGAATAASNLLLRRILDADYSFRWGEFYTCRYE
jgi:hypothetical protein